MRSVGATDTLWHLNGREVRKHRSVLPPVWRIPIRRIIDYFIRQLIKLGLKMCWLINRVKVIWHVQCMWLCVCASIYIWIYITIHINTYSHKLFELKKHAHIFVCQSWYNSKAFSLAVGRLIGIMIVFFSQKYYHKAFTISLKWSKNLKKLAEQPEGRIFMEFYLTW